MDSPISPDSSSAVSLTHAAIQRLARQSAACKLTSAIISGAAMLFAFSKTGTEGLLWAAAVPVGMLALADACYTAKARGFAALAGQFDGGRGLKWSVFFEHQVSGGGMKEAVQGLAGVLSLTVWPYYVALGLMVGGLGTLEIPKGPTTVLNAPFTMPSPGPGFSGGPSGAVFPAQQPRTYPPASAQGSFAPGGGPQPGPAGGGQPPGVNRSRFPTGNPGLPGNASPRPPGAGGTNPANTPPPANTNGLNRSLPPSAASAIRAPGSAGGGAPAPAASLPGVAAPPPAQAPAPAK